MFYVYVYKDPETNIPFYVGKGCKRRYRKHLFETWNNTTNKFRLSKIISIRSRGLEPLVEFIATDLDESTALALETQLITEYGKIYDKTGSLTNILDGGQQPPLGVGNPKWKTNNPSTAMKGVTYEERYGTTRAANIRLQRSKSLTNRQFSDNTRKKMADSASKRSDRHRYHKKVHTPKGIFNKMGDAANYYNIAASTLTGRVKSTLPQWEEWYYIT